MNNPREKLRALLQQKGLTPYLIGEKLNINRASIYNFLREENPSEMSVMRYDEIVKYLQTLPDKS